MLRLFVLILALLTCLQPDRNVTVCDGKNDGCVYSSRFGPNYNDTMHKVPIGSYTQCAGGAVCPFCVHPKNGVCPCSKPATLPTNKRRVNWYLDPPPIETVN